MMNDLNEMVTEVPTLVWLAGAFAIGGGIGAAYFTTLWMTVRALPAATHPGPLVFGSFFLRFAFAGLGLLLIVRFGGGIPLACALAGFILARRFIVRRLLSPDQGPAAGAQ